MHWLRNVLKTVEDFVDDFVENIAMDMKQNEQIESKQNQQIADTIQPYFNSDARESIYQVIAARRDMRHFISGKPIDEVVLNRMLHAAMMAPSVGLMQPWRFIRIKKTSVREEIANLVEQERINTANVLAERKDEFLKLKVEGVRECAELIVVAMAPDDGTVFGRRTLAYDTALGSVACAIQTLWLAARAENLGMGWVSLFEPVALAKLLNMPEGSKPIAILCLGHVEAFYAKPMLELENWRNAKPTAELLFTDTWGK